MTETTLRASVPVRLVLASLAALTWGCAARGGGDNEFPELAEYAGREIADVRFLETAPFSSDSLSNLIETQPSRCSLLGLPLCIPFTSLGRQVHELDPGTVTQDVRRLELFYRSEGFFGTQVFPEVEPDGDDVVVTFEIDRAPPLILDSLDLTGTEGVLDRDSLLARLPLQPGDTFDLGKLAASADTVLRALRALGRFRATVLRNFNTDTIRDRATVLLEAVPGPRVTVDSILVLGAENLGRTTTRRQLAFQEGDVLLQSQLAESQRNLYALELVQFASVAEAPDSLQAFPDDSSRATVLVSIVEAPEHQVDAAIGFGTEECLRTSASWEDRSFGGGARRLRVAGEVAKIGTGEVGGTLCSDDEFLDRPAAQGVETVPQSKLDYDLSADLVQPYFLNPRNSLTLNAYVERQSERAIFVRTAQGGRVAFGRRLADRTTLSAGFDVEHGQTIANASIYCAAFLVCLPQDIERLSQPRFRNTVSATLFRDRTDLPLNPTRGTTARAALAWAPPWLLSDVTFIRLNLEGAYYRELRPGWVAAAGLELGTFFQSATTDERDFLPPENRFYAGGATTVRGYTRNELGPGVWVTEPLVEGTDTLRGAGGVPLPDTTGSTPQFVPTGGTALIVGNLELRFPSPFLRDVLRLATFVDAGTVGTGNLWDREDLRLRVTPGIGFRMQTPVGPVRVDVAYNPHRPTGGPLFVRDRFGLYRVRDEFRTERTSFFSRLRVHLGVGQAF
jgi:outer membrane protein insertion porin family